MPARSPAHVCLTRYGRIDNVEPLARDVLEGLAVWLDRQAGGCGRAGNRALR